MSTTTASDVTERLRRRDEARRAALEQQRLEKEKTTVQEHTTSYFTEEFTKRRKSIEDLLVEAPGVSRDHLQQHLHHISSDLLELQKYLTDSTLFLTAHDVRTSQEVIAQLQQNYLSLKDQLQPKKKFAFKSRKKVTAPSVTPAATDVGLGKNGGIADGQRDGSTCSGVSSSSSTVLTNAVDIRDRTSEEIELQPDDIRGQDVALCNLTGCVIKLPGVPGTVHCSNARDCRILCGPVSRSVFVDGCCDCSFSVACQQLRVHTTQSSVFHLHVTSHPIIEDCSRLKFATYDWQYASFELHFTEAGLSHEVNNWNKVDDFNWLSSKEPSPNWSLLSSDTSQS